MKATTEASLAYERSARRGVTTWAILLVGIMFVWAGHTVDPLANCDESGDCAPWLVPIAAIIGWCATAIALGLLMVNPRRGYRIDATTGDLLWWKNSSARSVGDTGHMHPSRIVSIRIDLRGENDSVSLYGDDGERLAYFDEDLIPLPYDRWADRFQRAYPHIRIDRLD